MNYQQQIFRLLVITGAMVSIILFFSSQNGEISYGISGIVLEFLKETPFQMKEYTLRKVAHVFLYLFLGISSTCLVIYSLPMKNMLRYILGYIGGGVISTICAVLDEWNQSHIDGRTGIFSDVRYDAIGYLIGGLLAIALVVKFEKK